MHRWWCGSLFWHPDCSRRDICEKTVNMTAAAFVVRVSRWLHWISDVNIRVRFCSGNDLLSNGFRIEFVLCVGWPEWMEPVLRRRFGIFWRCPGTGGRTERVVVAGCRCRFGTVALESEAQLGCHFRAEGYLRNWKKRLVSGKFDWFCFFGKSIS